MRSDADQHETVTLQRRSRHRAAGLISASPDGQCFFMQPGGDRYRHPVPLAFLWSGRRHTETSPRIVIIKPIAASTNRSPPIWEMGDVVNVLQEWKNITR
jgi:hypothetical protein